MLGNDKILLLPPDISLAAPAAEYYHRNREFLQAFEPAREEAFFTAAYQEKLLKQEQMAWEAGTSARFYIQLPERPEQVIGIIGLNNIIRGAFQSAFLGYKLDKIYVNKGYMSMAVALVVQYAFEELSLHRIEANVMPHNRASLRVLEKNHFINEGMSRAYLKINGVWEDHIHMVRIHE